MLLVVVGTILRICGVSYDSCLVVAVITRVSLILADVIAIVATWWSMHRQVREALHLKIGPSASGILLANGACIFGDLPDKELSGRFAGSVYFM